MTKTIEDITNFIFIGKPIEELSHYDLLIINADWVEEQLSKDIRIMKDKNIIDDNTVFIVCEGHQPNNNRSSANILIDYLKKENINNKIIISDKYISKFFHYLINSSFTFIPIFFTYISIIYYSIEIAFFYRKVIITSIHKPSSGNKIFGYSKYSIITIYIY